MNKLDEAFQNLEESNTLLEAIFPPQNAIFVKVLNYQIEYWSSKDDNDKLMQKSQELVDLTLEINEVEGDPKSIFNMDAYLNHVSSASQADRHDVMNEFYEKLEVLGFEHKIPEGTHLMHSAVSMKCIALVR